MNVLFIVSDDLNNDARLLRRPAGQVAEHRPAGARAGVRFDRAYCQFPLCNPSRVVVPDRPAAGHDRVYENADAVPQERARRGHAAADCSRRTATTSPASASSTTTACPARSAPTASTTRHRGSEVVNPRGRDKDDEDKIFTLKPGPGFGGTLSWLAADGTDEEQTDGKVADRGDQAARSSTTTEPFFLAVGFFRPHTPYVAPKKYFDLYPLDEIELPQVPDRHRERRAAGRASTRQDRAGHR